MKKFLFLLAMLLIIAGLIAGVTKAVPQVDERNAQPRYPNRDIFYTEDFETGATGWTHFDGAVTPNNWHVYNNADAQGDVWWMGDPANGGYHDHQYLVLDTAVIPISTGNSTLTFKMRHGLEAPGASGDYNGWDSFNIRISTNSGVTYTVIPGTITSPTYDFTDSYAFGSEFGEGLGVPGWGGMRTAWTTVTVDLSSYLVSGAASVKIRFAFASDPAYNTDDDPTMFGVMVDDVALAGYSNNGVLTGMSFTSLVPTAGDFWHLATDASAPSPTHIMSSMNSFGTYVPYMLNYLESPSIALPAGATQIVADFQLKGTYTDTGTFPDVDYFGWEVFHNGTWRYMSNPLALPSPAPNYVYSSAPDNWASMINSYTLDGDITAFAGSTVKFRWYFQSNDDVNGTPLQIDNFQIFSVSAAPAPPNLVYPINGATNLPVTGFDLDWTASSLGALPEYYKVYMDMTEANLEIATFAPGYESLDLTVSLYNPVTAGLLTYASSQTWYWRVVAFIAGQDEAYSEIFRFDIVNVATVISTFPWNEGFENATFPPTGWTLAQLYLDTDATNWTVNTTSPYFHAGTKSAVHAYNATTPEPGQNGWLISPPVQLPATGVPAVSFWNYNRYGYEIYNGLMINTTNDPYDPFWVELWSQDEAAGYWAQETVNLTAYAGDMVYFAFKYTGFDGNNWYVDDVNVTIYTEDVMPPIIGHLPLLNTPLTVDGYYVVADIADDAVFSSPLIATNVFYSIDGGTIWSAAIPMTPSTAPSYSAVIPAQVLGTTVTYKIVATDSANNTATTTNFSFMVADPTWVQYDDNLPLSYTGFPTSVWGPMIYYENPLYGTGTPLKLLAVDGAVHNNNAGNPPTLANLHIYGDDGVDMFDLTGAIPVTFTHRTRLETDISAYDIQITTPYFWISYEDMPLGCYFQYDATYNYTTLYLMMSGSIYTSSSTGEWCIGAYVESGAVDVNVVTVAGNPELSWNEIIGASSYKVYGSADPYAADPWTLLGSPTTTSYTYTGTANMQFFKVTAVSAPVTRGTQLPNPSNARLLNEKIKAVRAD